MKKDAKAREIERLIRNVQKEVGLAKQQKRPLAEELRAALFGVLQRAPRRHHNHSLYFQFEGGVAGNGAAGLYLRADGAAIVHAQPDGRIEEMTVMEAADRFGERRLMRIAASARHVVAQTAPRAGEDISAALKRPEAARPAKGKARRSTSQPKQGGGRQGRGLGHARTPRKPKKNR